MGPSFRVAIRFEEPSRSAGLEANPKREREESRQFVFEAAAMVALGGSLVHRKIGRILVDVMLHPEDETRFQLARRSNSHGVEKLIRAIP